MPLPSSMRSQVVKTHTDPVKKTPSPIRTHRETSESDAEIGRGNLETVDFRESDVMSSSIVGVGLSFDDFADTDIG